MIPINAAIDSGDWLHANLTFGAKTITYGIRINEFTKVDLSKIGKPSQFCSGIPADSNIWLLRLDVINTGDDELYGFRFVKIRLILKDDDGFEFRNFYDDLITERSPFAKKCGASKFLNNKLTPRKIYSGALLYEMPASFEGISLAVSDGDLI